MRGRILDRTHLAAMEGESLCLGGSFTGCGGRAYGSSGGGSGYKTEVWVDDGGTRVAVLLLDARHSGSAQPRADRAVHDAVAALHCRA